MAVPGIASTMLLNIILAWNEAFWTIVLTTTKAAPHGLHRQLLGAAGPVLRNSRRHRRWPSCRSLSLGWFSQKQLVRGLTFGAVK
jgi:sorbitol/mannitol transport system permease protein